MTSEENVQVAAESAFAPTGIDTAAADFIKQMESEYSASDLAGENDGAANVADDAVAPVAADGVAGLPPETAETASPPVEAGLERLVGREVELRQREDRIKATESEMASMRAEIQALRAVQVPKDLVNELRTQPVSVFEKLGLNPDDVIRMALAQKLGPKAPAELRQTIEQNQTRAQIEALERKVIAQSQEAAAKQYFDTVANGARQYVTQGTIKDAPTVSEVAKTAPDRVHREIMQEIISDAQVRSAREPNGDVLSYDEAAKRVEARWSEYRKLLTPAQIAAASQAPTTAPAKDTKTPPVPNKSTSTSIKAPDRPLAPWLQRVDVMEEGLRAGIDEFRRSEVERNKVR
jgi:antitoxin component of RelBE/YafQ-DinJ toxin-antitoxin module